MLFFQIEMVVGTDEFFQSVGGFGEGNEAVNIITGDGFFHFKPNESNFFGHALNTGGEVVVQFFWFI